MDVVEMSTERPWLLKVCYLEPHVWWQARISASIFGHKKRLGKAIQIWLHRRKVYPTNLQRISITLGLRGSQQTSASGCSSPKSIAQIPVPVPISSTWPALAPLSQGGAIPSLSLKVSRNRVCCKSGSHIRHVNLDGERSRWLSPTCV